MWDPAAEIVVNLLMLSVSAKGLAAVILVPPVAVLAIAWRLLRYGS